MRISKSLWPGFSPYGVVTYRGIPLYRCQAWALELVDHAGVTPRIISGIRDDAVIAAHNRQFGTNLHGQQYLVNLAASGRGNPANPVNQTSHCDFSDGSTIYGHYAPKYGRLPKVVNGIDALDNATAGRIVAKLNQLGFPASLPYSSGSELHHFSLTPNHVNDYVKRLRRKYLKLWVARHRKRRKK
jgi:hypothetical protein